MHATNITYFQLTISSQPLANCNINHKKYSLKVKRCNLSIHYFMEYVLTQNIKSALGLLLTITIPIKTIRKLLLEKYLKKYIVLIYTGKATY